MVNIEPYYNWRNVYISSEDERSPFFNREYNAFNADQKIYNHLIHSQWDYFGSNTLYAKIIFTDYDEGFTCIELIGEWNDCINNDIMHFKRNVLDDLIFQDINKYVLIGENVLNFHFSDECYYEEWKEEIGDGWIALVNFQEHVLNEMAAEHLFAYFESNEELNLIAWRTYNPQQLYKLISEFFKYPELITWK
ncbi:hypothetical protein IH981_01015 [Patescibacteria group bacterium]|nr:hypothetical protein [Patescibacteria group bacterium]